MAFQLGPRRAVYVDISEEMKGRTAPLLPEQVAHFEDFDLIYRSTCGLLYNYVPMSGHPGGSISSGRFVAAILFDALEYDLGDPQRSDADIISYAAGHKALGLYTMWALRNEVARLGAPELLPHEERMQLRLEDLLGFRRNPVSDTPLFAQHHAKALDGHPTPATPFVRLATGASGVGVSTSLGLALGAADYYGDHAPKVHVIEGEGGMTPGRVAEAMAAAGTACLRNVVMHLDWNQASIDSNKVCRDGDEPGDYVQWDPRELAYINDWNVVYVPDGFDFQQIIAAQRYAADLNNGQPTIIVYRTVKGWKYGVEGRASHGAGHKLCSPGFYDALGPLSTKVELTLPHCEDGETRCQTGCDPTVVEDCFWEALSLVRLALVDSSPTVNYLADRLREAKVRLDGHARQPRADAPRVAAIYEAVTGSAETIPEELRLQPGTKSTLRGELGRVLSYLNRASGGAVLAAAADLLGSTSVDKINAGFPEGYFKLGSNPGSRLLSIGGICEDAISGMLAGMSTFGHQIGVGSSYGAFMAPLGHISARLHAIGCQARQAAFGDPFNPFVLVCAHAGLKTGEDGPTHADPQALQLLQENFPKGTMFTLTPWDPQELWPLMAASLERHPAVVAPFVTRPGEPILDRAALGLPPATAATQGVYALRQAKGAPDAVVVIQGSGVAYAFIQETLSLLDEAGVDVTAYYVASAELFDALSPEERERIYPEEHARIAMGITGFTLPTMYRWITSKRGRAATQHPFMKGHFLGSGQASKVLSEAGLDGRGQFDAIMKYRSAVAVS